MTESTITDTFRVVLDLCIACDACCQDFPELFYMGDDEKAHEKDDQQADKYNARSVVDCCPTDAIVYSGELPEAEDEANLEEVSGWEAPWAVARDVPEDLTERDRRYGRDYEVAKETGYVHVRLQLPMRVPAVRDRFRFGLDEEMPAYATHVWTQDNSISITAWVTDPKMRVLTHGSSSFPGRFTTTWDMPKDLVGFKHRVDGHGGVEIILFTDKTVRDSWVWEAHFITDLCTACSICERVCPTNAITSGDQYFIDPALCINCSVCGIYCPFDAIEDSAETIVEKIKPKQIPKAIVIEELCTGCEFCEDVCPFDAIEMQLHEDGFNRIAVILPKACTSCKLCEQVCIKDAIVVPREHVFEDIGMSFMNYLYDQNEIPVPGA
jgi:ferredoxin/Fe-S-cluster containining protein